MREINELKTTEDIKRHMQETIDIVPEQANVQVNIQVFKNYLRGDLDE